MYLTPTSSPSPYKGFAVQIVSYRANRNKNDSTLEELVALGEWAKYVLDTNNQSLGGRH